MQNTAIIRRIDGELAWYPPGASDGVHWLRLDSEQEALRAAIAERRLLPIFAVPGEEVRLLRLAITAQERRHLAKSLPFMLEEELAADIEDLHFASCELDRLEYAVAVCSREHMHDYAALLAHYPGVAQWIPEPLLLPWQAGEWSLVLEGNGAIVRTGQAEGFSVERNMVPAMLQAALAEGDAPQAVVIYGQEQAADLALLPQELAQRAQWRSGDLYAAMLIAERPEPALNLRQGEFARKLPLKRWWRQWRVAAVLFAVAVGLHLLATGLDYRQLKEQNIALRTAVQESYRLAYPRGAIVDPEKQLQRQLDAMSGSGEGSGFVALMQQVGSVVSASKGTDIVSINYSDKANEMRLNIVAADYGAVEQVREGINGAGLEAVMENSSAQGDKVRARLRVRGRS